MIPLERGSLRARLGDGAEDRARILALRATAFPHRDGSAEIWETLDEACRHVMVEGEGGALLATFRVLEMASGRDLPHSYCARHYDLAPLAGYSRPLAEMGRFCLAAPPGALAADALRLGWAAMARLVDSCGAGLVLGCTSFPGADWWPHRAALALLAQDHLGPAGLRPGLRAAEVVAYPRLAGAPGDRRVALAGLPSLLRSYLAMGAWVSDHAVVDRQLDTLHVLTCLPVERVPPARAMSLRALAALPMRAPAVIARSAAAC
ncbi:MAG: GNAT family N-acetyltransferase [Rhodobacteraceae bacterium]|nr:GNAT family N-acetyltransferase [Paracoccaceae bacterium]